ncbi:MAG: hypothetical protein ACUVSX_12290 [Aggregatilineales bacterium]
MNTTETGNAPSSLMTGLAFIAGAGLAMMVVTAAVGVIQGENASAEALGLLFALGVVFLIGGVGAWLAVERPFAHFDDINVPAPDEHHHDDDHQPADAALAAAPHHELT